MLVAHHTRECQRMLLRKSIIGTNVQEMINGTCNSQLHDVDLYSDERNRDTGGNILHVRKEERILGSTIY